jgi:tRNA (adenine37-N6)-methyltransferase
VDEIRYTPVGVIRSPFEETAGMPIQAVGAKGVEGSVELAPAYHDGLRDVEGFSHLILVYHFHLARSPSLTIGPLLDHEPRGIFATRSPKRPNPIGLSVVRLVGVEGGTFSIRERGRGRRRYATAGYQAVRAELRRPRGREHRVVGRKRAESLRDPVRRSSRLIRQVEPGFGRLPEG